MVISCHFCDLISGEAKVFTVFSIKNGIYDQIVQSAENTFFGDTENSGKKAVSQMAVVFKACAEKIYMKETSGS